MSWVRSSTERATCAARMQSAAMARHQPAFSMRLSMSVCSEGCRTFLAKIEHSFDFPALTARTVLLFHKGWGIWCMRTPTVYRLTFLLPPALGLMARPGRHSPCLHGCVLTIERDLLVSIDGPSRERVFDQAQRFLRVVTKGIATPNPIAAWLCSPCGRRDGWSIIIRAEIAIVPTLIPGALYSAEQKERAG
jgi:hypothetical protein